MGNSYGPQVVTNGLVCYIDAANSKSVRSSGNGETVFDLSRNNNNFTIRNGNLFLRNNSILFSGQYLEASNTGMGNWGTGGYTIEIGYNIFTGVSFNAPFVKRTVLSSIGISGAAGYAQRIGVSFFAQDNNPGGARVTTDIFESQNSRIGSPSVNTNCYYSFTFNRSNSGMNNTGYYYLNGALLETQSPALTGGNQFVGSTSSLCLFGGPNTTLTTGSFYFLRLYNRYLTDAEIKQNFNALRGRYNL